MKQLNIQDTGFIYNELPRTPMHICGFGLYDQNKKRKRKTKESFIASVEPRLHNAPILKQKLQHAGNWERPFWVPDENFQLANHVEVVDLPEPGTYEQLMATVGQILAEPLDMEIPLWKVYIIEGLTNVDGLSKNSFALLTKIHHSCVDGSSGESIMAVLHDMEENPKPVEVTTAPGVLVDTSAEDSAKRQLGKYEQRALTFGSNLLDLLDQTSAVADRMPTLVKTSMDLYRGKKTSGARLRVPATRFNKTPSTERVFALADFALEDIKAIKNAVPGITVNDVMVSIVGGAMRKYLQHHDELPEQSLGAVLPQNTRSADDNSNYGNQVGGLFATLYTDIGDPLERLLAVHESVVKAKSFAEEVGTGSIFPNLMGGFLYPRWGKSFAKFTQEKGLMGKLGPIVFNTMITNVPGPDFPLYHQGSKLQTYCGVPPLTDGMGIAHAVYSFCGKISISVVACGEAMKDSEFYISCCEDAFEDLWNATQAEEYGTETLAETAVA